MNIVLNEDKCTDYVYNYLLLSLILSESAISTLAATTKIDPKTVRGPTLSLKAIAPTIMLVIGSRVESIAALSPPIIKVPRWKSTTAKPFTKRANATESTQPKTDFGKAS